jgi:uncharacterized protein YraI
MIKNQNRIPKSTLTILAVLGGLTILLFILIITRSEVRPLAIRFIDRGFRNGGDTETSLPNAEMTSSAEPANSISAIQTITSTVPVLTASRNVEILSGPGDLYPAIAILEAGQSLRVIGVNGDTRWWIVEIPYLEAGHGWVSAELVSVSNPGEVPLIEQATLTAVTNVNIREGPGMEYAKVGVLEINQIAEIAGVTQDGFWWAVKLPGEGDDLGWVSSDYVVARDTEYVPIINNAGSTSVSPGSNLPELIANTVVNIRSGPGTEFEIVGKLLQGQKAKVVGVSADRQWWVIQIPGSEDSQGWVAASFVAAENSTNVPVIP